MPNKWKNVNGSHTKGKRMCDDFVDDENDVDVDGEGDGRSNDNLLSSTLQSSRRLFPVNERKKSTLFHFSSNSLVRSRFVSSHSPSMSSTPLQHIAGYKVNIFVAPVPQYQAELMMMSTTTVASKIIF